MRTKPTAARPIIVCKVKHVWRGMFMAYCDGSTNCALYDAEGLNFSLYEWEVMP